MQEEVAKLVIIDATAETTIETPEDPAGGGGDSTRVIINSRPFGGRRFFHDVEG